MVAALRCSFVIRSSRSHVILLVEHLTAVRLAEMDRTAADDDVSTHETGCWLVAVSVVLLCIALASKQKAAALSVDCKSRVRVVNSLVHKALHSLEPLENERARGKLVALLTLDVSYM